jgi:hypothetical protein
MSSRLVAFIALTKLPCRNHPALPIRDKYASLDNIDPVMEQSAWSY